MNTKKKSILILGNYPPPYGGVPQHIEYLAPYLVEKGWDVHILPVGRSGVEKKNGITIYKYPKAKKIFIILKSLLKLKIKGGLRLRTVLFDSPMWWLTYMLKASIGRQIIEKNGINIISAYNLLSNGPVGATLSEEYNVPLVFTNFGEIFSERSFFEKHVKIVKSILSKTKKVLSCSQHCAESYKLLGLAPHAEVIPYGVDIKNFNPDLDGARIRQSLGIKKEDKVILFVGRMNRDMGLHVVLEIIPPLLEKDKKIKFVIVGGKGELFESALKSSSEYSENVFVIPDVPFEELAFYYAASTVVLTPTIGDRACSSLAAMEAMAAGKPVIASKIGGIPEVVVNRRTGILVPPEDPAALSTAILNLIDNEQSIRQMGLDSRERAETLFDKDKTNQKMEHIFGETAGV